MKSQAQQLLEKLHNITMNGGEEIEAGYHDVPFYAKEWNMSIRQARYKLTSAVQLGLATNKSFRLNCGGYMRNIYHYAKT
jgi:hypothetical protein